MYDLLCITDDNRFLLLFIVIDSKYTIPYYIELRILDCITFHSTILCHFIFYGNDFRRNPVAFDSKNKSFSGNPFQTEEPLKSEQLKSTLQNSYKSRSPGAHTFFFPLFPIKTIKNMPLHQPTVEQPCVFQSLADIAAKSFGSIERLSCCRMKLVTSRASFVAGGCCWGPLEHVPGGLMSSRILSQPASGQ